MGGKRGQNEGSICLTKAGKWHARVTVGGKRLSANKDSKREAQLWLRQVLSQGDKGMTYGSEDALRCPPGISSRRGRVYICGAQDQKWVPDHGAICS
jgi:hypothetical protein